MLTQSKELNNVFQLMAKLYHGTNYPFQNMPLSRVGIFCLILCSANIILMKAGIFPLLFHELGFQIT